MDDYLLNKEIRLAKQRLADLRKARRMLHKYSRLDRVVFKPSVYFVFSDIVDSLIFFFLRLVRRDE